MTSAGNPGSESATAAPRAERASGPSRWVTAVTAADPEGSEASPRQHRAPPVFLVGEIVAERFRIEEFLGQGGMGQVFAARDLELGSDLALKVIRPDFADRPRMVERFKQEIQLARRVTHPHVCRIFDLLKHREAESDDWGHRHRTTLLLGMELLRGPTLAERLAEHGPIPAEQALPLARQLASALDAAHGAGIEHGDLKAGNVIWVEEARQAAEPRLVVTDFGLARLENAGKAITSFVGTPAYASPELLAGRGSGIPSDIYSFGLLLYEMLVGQLPEREQPDSAPVLAADLPPAWRKAIEGCLQADPEARFGSAGEVIEALESSLRRAARSHVRRGLWIVLPLLLLASGLVAWHWQLERRSAEEAPTRAARASVAVLGVQNLSESGEGQWLETALAEMLASELAADGRLRIASGELVARMRGELALGNVASPAPDTLERAQRYLGSDFLASGAYLEAERDGRPLLRLDLRLADGRSGEIVAAFVLEQEKADLLELISRAGRRIRHELGLDAAESSSPNADPALPSTPEGLRNYAVGLGHLRRFEPELAIDHLERALEGAPDSPTVLITLARARDALGYDRRAEQLAARAVAEAADLGRERRLAIEAVHHELAHDWPSAIVAYRSLWHLYPDNPDYGRSLALSLARSGDPDSASRTLEAVRDSVFDTESSPRFAIAEAEVAELGSDYPRQLTLARRAIHQLERGAPHASGGSLGEALLLETTALHHLGRDDEARERAGELRRLFLERHDRRGLARATLRLAEARFDTDLMDPEEALDELRRIGDRERQARLLVTMARPLMSSEKTLPEARRMLDQAADLARETHNARALAEALNGRAMLEYVSENERRSVELFRQAYEAARRSGHLRSMAGMGMNLGLVLRILGDFEEARPLLESAVEIFRRIRSLSDLSKALGNLTKVDRALGNYDAGEEHAMEALEIARQLEDPNLEGQALASLAVIAKLRKDPARALRLYEQMVELLAARDAPYAERSTNDLLRVSLMLDLGHLDDADALLGSLEARHPIDTSELSHQIRILGARARLLRGRPRAAVIILRQIYPKVLTFERPRVRGRILSVAEAVERTEGHETAIRDRLREIATRARDTGDTRLELEALFDLVRLDIRHGQLGDARSRLLTLRHRAEPYPWLLRSIGKKLEAVEAETEIAPKTGTASE